MSDVIESLTGVVFLQTGLHGSLAFLKSINVLESDINVEKKYTDLIEQYQSISMEPWD
jgi:hypothetical protein